MNTHIAIRMAAAGAVVAALGTAVYSTSNGPYTTQRRVERGKYLVTVGGCNDCHTPLKMGPNGPEPDMARMLSGHPDSFPISAGTTPATDQWMMTAAVSGTAFSGPWGVSFTANLTPDPETGLGRWTEDMFVATMKTGRHQGKGRPILPPMPYPNVGGLNDEDIRAVFAYLQSLPPVSNRVPAPIDPPEGGR